ncbi:anti-sigma-D factor RsdA [Rhodococcus sp. GOMB7]|uniref:anti-sigma-D factor RsdA n=1 Tax=Rhodococcus sp. GOMB7 TaxID=2839033 RepID=UPI0027E271F5|nr:anti-sigma-D factor RsdA [Rhodococcus sp. GOMB7]
MRALARDEGHDASNLGDLADDGTPVDLAAVRRDDALIESISNGGPVATDSTEQYELALILSQWRDDVVATPMPEGPLLDDVIAAITATPSGFSDRQRSRSRSRLRVVRPIAAAAAVAAVVFGGATAMAYDAQPGDALWGVKQVVFADEANSTVAKIDTTSELEKAERLLAAGDIPAAKMVLDNAAHRADAVKDSQDKTDLVERWGKLMTQVQETTSPAVPPSTTDQQSSIATSPTAIPGISVNPANPQLPGGVTTTTTPNPGIMQAPGPSAASSTPSSSPTATTTTTTTTTTTMTPLAPASSPSGDSSSPPP